MAVASSRTVQNPTRPRRQERVEVDHSAAGCVQERICADIACRIRVPDHLPGGVDGSSHAIGSAKRSDIDHSNTRSVQERILGGVAHRLRGAHNLSGSVDRSGNTICAVERSDT